MNQPFSHPITPQDAVLCDPGLDLALSFSADSQHTPTAPRYAVDAPVLFQPPVEEDAPDPPPLNTDTTLIFQQPRQETSP